MAIGLDNMGGTSVDRVENEQADILGGSAGEEMHQLTVDEMPSHNHSFLHHRADGVIGNQAIKWLNNDDANLFSTNNSGDSQPHNNMPPFLAVNYIIKF
jgi:microcystin-dependent protein